MRGKPSSRTVERTADLLHGSAIRLLRFVRREDAAAGVPPAQLSVLSVLVFAGPQTLSALAAAEQVRLPTMSQLVSEIERKGLAKRRPLDGRTVEISATEKGAKLLEAGRRRRLARLSEALAGLSRDDLALLEKSAAILKEAIAPQD